jgi:hypothetical protein
MPEQYIITGTILPANGADHAGVRVQAFDRDLPSLERRTGTLPQLLGEVIADAEGRFQITYTLGQFQSGEGISQFRRVRGKNADLSFRVFDRAGQELNIRGIEALDREYRSGQIIFNAPGRLDVRISVESLQQAGDSEYEKLLALIAPVIADVSLAELTEEDILFLINETGLEQQLDSQKRIEWLRRSALLAQLTNLPVECFYGWGRKDLPASFDELARVAPASLLAVLNKLLSHTVAELQSVLLAALSERIIPASLRDGLAEITGEIERLRVERGFVTARRFVGRLVNEEGGAPLAGLIVQGFDLDAGEVPKNLGQDVTSTAGLFALLYHVPKSEGDQPQRKLRLEITLDPQTQAKHTAEVRAGTDQDILEIRMPRPAPVELPDQQLDRLAGTLQIDLPQELRTFLADKKIDTLAGIRRAGGSIGRLEGLPLAADHQSIRLLEAHADLSRLSPDAEVNAQLIKKRYDSVLAVAQAPRSDFVNDVHEHVGDFGAAELHVIARAQNHFLNNVVTGMSVEQANGFKPDALMAAESAPPPRCGCDNCEAAVSPLAYLADLLKYSVQHVKNSNAAITLDTLADTFHQPFGALAASCDAFETRVCQVRLAVEVLRSYLQAHPPNAAQQAALDESEKQYRLAAYTLLLPRLGASYGELRLTQSAELEDRRTLAERMGIEEKRLDGLVLDPETLTEGQLEQLFGLADTTRDPLAAGSIPQLQTWRLEYLRTLWRAQDERSDASPDIPPIIDPDLIGPADLKNPAAGDPAFDLWQARVDSLAAQLALLEAAPKTVVGFDSILTQTLGIPLSAFLDIAAARKNGDAVSKDLDQLKLSPEAFGHLLRVRTLASLAQPILDEEWEGVYAILLQVTKGKLAAQWRAEERAAKLLLSSDFFQLPPSAVPTFPSPRPSAAELWRAPRDARRAWQDNLESRLDQEQNVIEALREAVSATEQTALPPLRDALVLATDAPGSDLPSKAEWVTQNLLIDARMDGCATTTRAAQAMETIQGLLTSLRAEQLRKIFQTFTLNADHFDDEWKWLGSYAPWRSAMFVFMYPENLCNPNLRRHQTAGFRTLLSTTQSPRRVTPGIACSAAKQYAEYFRDVCTMRVEASCTSRTRLFRDSDACKAETGYRCLFYMFGRGGVSGKVYWSSYDMQDGSGYAQTFWQPIQIAGFENIVEIVGAVPYQITAEQRCIFLFAKKADTRGEQLVYIRYDLEKAEWNAEAISLAMPPSFTAVVRQQDSETFPPQIAVTIPVSNGRGIYERRLHVDGSGWEDGDFHPLVAFGEVLSMLGSPDDFYLVYHDNRGVITCSRWTRLWVPVPGSAAGTRYRLVSGSVFGNFSGVSLSFLPNVGQYLGAFTWPERDYIYVVTTPLRNTNNALSGIILLTLPRARVWRVRHVGTNALEVIEVDSPFGFSEPRIAPTAGVVEDGTTKSKRLVYQVDGGIAFMDRFLNLSDPGDLYPKQPLPVMPSVTGPFDLSGQLSSKDLQLRKALIQKAFTANQNGPASNLAYLHEAYLFVAVQLALGLQRTGEYSAALDWLRTVYDYTAPPATRKIYHGLVAEESLGEVYKRGQDWLLDPLNPHSIAATRRNTYTRYTLQLIARCLLDYADVEFTFDTAESNPLARRLYLIVLELLETAELKQHLGDCEETIGILDDVVLGPRWSTNVQALKLELKGISNPGALKNVVAQAQMALTEEGAPERRFANARAVVSHALAELPPPTLKTVLDKETQANVLVQQAVLQSATLDEAVRVVGRAAANDFQRKVSMVTGASAAQLVGDRKELPWLRQSIERTNGATVPATTAAVVRSDAARPDILVPAHISDLAEVAATQPMVALGVSGAAQPSFFPSVISAFCIPPNPVLNTLRLRAGLNLYKLRTCRNIAGMRRELDVYAAPTDTTSGLPVIGAGGQLLLPGANVIRPSLYHERILKDRAKELVQAAAQIEAEMLAALEKGAVERYTMLKARQELGLAQAGVRLQSLRVTRADHGVKLAELQQERASIQVKTYEEWIAKGLNEYEEEMLKAYSDVAVLQTEIAGIEASIQLAQAVTTAATASVGAAAASTAAVAVGFFAGLRGGKSWQLAEAQKTAQVSSFNASYERRKDEWLLQQALGQQDIKIGEQAIVLAHDDVDIGQQERAIAELGASHAKDVVEFLSNKFNNVALYDSMSATLETVYNFFLRQATAVAKVYENQVAFLRQEAPLGIIKGDYWATPRDDGGIGNNSSAADRKGLTGSARLLQAIYQLDQYAFDTRKRKLSLTKTISLAGLAPAEFQQFRETGLIVFNTPAEMFDREFPGHYLRIISRVRTSIIALIPSTNGIHATLSTSGLSRVVIGPDVFQTVPIRKDPEFVALSTPINATGVLEMDVQQSELLFPFEGCGVDTTWELRMPKAANQFDYRTIADVLVTIEFTALDSFDYRQQVIQTLRPRLSADLALSFRHHLADQWYDLHNPEQTKAPMTVKFTTGREDFPPNLEALKIQQVVIHFSRAVGKSFEVPVSQFRFTEKGNAGPVGGAATSVDGAISTRRGNGATWASSFIGKDPVGEWELVLPNTEEMRNRFAGDDGNEDIADILFVITYSGRTPEWPN